VASGDVLHEQLDELLAHEHLDCPPDCRTCERLAYVERILMEPFRTVVFDWHKAA
jgi:hypothetical protein